MEKWGGQWKECKADEEAKAVREVISEGKARIIS